MLCNQLPVFQPPALDSVPYGRYALFQTGKVATVTGVMTQRGRMVEWGEPLLEVVTDGALEESVTAPATGIVRWIHPHIGTLRHGSPVALLEVDRPAPRLDTARVFIPHSAPLPPTVTPTAELPLTTALLNPERRSTMRLPFELEEIKEVLEFPYNLNNATKRRTFHLTEGAGNWINQLAEEMKLPIASVVEVMIYQYAMLTTSQRRRVMRAWQKAKKESGK